jgi:hypothetical protein
MPAIFRSLSNPKVGACLAARIQSLTPQTPPRWGLMSSAQMLRHLNLAFQMALGDYTVANSSNRKLNSPLARFVSLTLPVRWPKGIATLPETDVVTQLHPCVFSQERSTLIGLLTRFSQAKPPDLRATHPILGPFTHAQWMRWGFRHTDHHLRQFGC